MHRSACDLSRPLWWGRNGVCDARARHGQKPFCTPNSPGSICRTPNQRVQGRLAGRILMQSSMKCCGEESNARFYSPVVPLWFVPTASTAAALDQAATAPESSQGVPAATISNASTSTIPRGSGCVEVLGSGPLYSGTVAVAVEDEHSPAGDLHGIAVQQGVTDSVTPLPNRRPRSVSGEVVPIFSPTCSLASPACQSSKEAATAVTMQAPLPPTHSAAKVVWTCGGRLSPRKTHPSLSLFTANRYSLLSFPLLPPPSLVSSSPPTASIRPKTAHRLTLPRVPARASLRLPSPREACPLSNLTLAPRRALPLWLHCRASRVATWLGPTTGPQ